MADSFDPSPGPLCGWCPHVANCPEGLAEVRRRLDAQSEEAALAVQGELASARASEAWASTGPSTIERGRLSLLGMLIESALGGLFAKK